MTTTRLILASQSPRRRELLSKAGYQFQIIAPSEQAEQGIISGEGPGNLVQRLARQKAQDVAVQIGGDVLDDCLILGCDTVAVCDGMVLGKPRDRPHARQMLRLMRGKQHSVLSGVYLQRYPVKSASRVAVDETVLVMDDVTDQQIDEYLNTDLWIGKAGAFGFQDGLNWISIRHGSESNVVGLAMELLARMISELETTSV